MNFQDFIQIGINKGLNNIQITAKTNEAIEFEFINEKLDNYINTNHIEYLIKAEKNGKTEKLNTDYLDEEIIDLLILKINNTDSNYKDEYVKKIEIECHCDNTDVNVDNELDEIKEMYKLKNKDKRISTITIAYEDSITKTQIINSNGANLQTEVHNYMLYTDILIETNDEKISYDKQILKTHKEEINVKEFIEKTIDEAILMINKESLKTGKYDIILSQKVSSNLLGKMIEMFDQSNIRNKTSCMCEKLHKKIFNEKITIIEDPINNKYPGFRSFDDEGTITKYKTIIKDGKLNMYLSNIKEAKIIKTESTGNSYGGISTRNLYLNPGKTTFNEMLEKIKDGLYITDFMGASNTSISTTTGNISIQIFGFIIKDGRIKNGFNPCIMTTTIFELLNNVKDIGNQIEFTNVKAASPILYIENISIASSE